jgi:hypothetical protein
MIPPKNQPKLKCSGITQIKGKDIASYEAKLDYAHQFGVKSLEVDILQFPLESNYQTCICKAKLETDDGKTFIDIGDASPTNVPRGCVDNYIRMASTRAKSRVLADAFNIRSAIQYEMNHANHESYDNNIIDVDFSEVIKPIIENSQTANAGGGVKPASDKQLALIKSLSSQLGSSAKDMADNMFSKQLGELHGFEANQMIKRLKQID